MKPTYRVKDLDSLGFMINAIMLKIRAGLATGPVLVTLGRDDTRTQAQNKKMWPMLSDVSKQVEWHGQKPTSQEWKSILSAAIDGQKCFPGINGGLVFCGVSTSNLSKARFAELIECIYAFGSDQGVVWSEKALKAYEDYQR